jgi:hypothetical protein
MAPRPATIRMYTTESEVDALQWSWVEGQLVDAGTYWVVARSDGFPHPRAVCGVWSEDELLLSLGSPVLRRELAARPEVTVHLDSGTDVVIVEGIASVGDDDSTTSRFRSRYDEKYDWTYDLATYGPPTRIRPIRAFAWRAAGAAGRDGFRQVGKWRFE